MQCSKPISFNSLLALPEQLTTKVLWMTDCNLVCSLEEESPKPITFNSLLALPEQLTTKVLWMTDCNLVCSLEEESPRELGIEYGYKPTSHRCTIHA